MKMKKNNIPGGGLDSKSCLTLVTPMDCSPTGSSVHGTSQARILEYVIISFSRRLFYPGIKSVSSAWQAVYCTTGRFFTTEPSGKPQNILKKSTTQIKQH